MNDMYLVYLSLGSNLGNRFENLQQAILRLNKTVGKIVSVSAVYENEAFGFIGGDFLNICLSLKTTLSPKAVLHELLSIESEMGRQRSNDSNYQSRTLDIDLLYYGNEVIISEELTLPHPRLHERRFVLKPLADIAPQFYHPKLNKDSRNMLQECRDKSTMRKIDKQLHKTYGEIFASTQFMVIEGNIGAGKTTLTKKIAEDFNAKLILERFADNPFLPKFYNDQSRYAFPLEMSFLADRYQQFTEDAAQLDLFKNFMLSDYEVTKSLIFAQITLQKEEFELYRRLFNLMYKEVKKPKLYVYLYQNTNRLLANIKKRAREYEQRIEASYLEKINEGYVNFLKTVPEQNKLIIDLKEMDFVAERNDYEHILQTIANKIITLS